MKFVPLVLLAALVLAVFGQVAGFGFVDYDDPVYVTENPVLAEGLGSESLAHAFRSNYYSGK